DATNPNDVWGLTSYGGNGGTITRPEGPPLDNPTTNPVTSQGFLMRTSDGVLFRSSKVRLGEIKDGPSKTLLIGEWTHFDATYERLCGPGTVQGEGSVTNGWWANPAPNDVVRSTRVPINWKFPANATYCK